MTALPLRAFAQVISPIGQPRGRQLPVYFELWELNVNLRIPTFGKLSLWITLWIELAIQLRLLVTIRPYLSVRLIPWNKLTLGFPL